MTTETINSDPSFAEADSLLHNAVYTTKSSGYEPEQYAAIQALLRDLGETYADIEKDEQELDECWTNEGNWHFASVIYKCADDPRKMVRKRYGTLSGFLMNTARNSTIGNERKDRHARHIGRKDNIKKLLREQYSYDPSAIYLPATLQSCQDRLAAIEIQITQFDQQLQIMCDDSKHWFKDGTYYACYNDYRFSVPAKTGSGTQHNWNANKTLFSMRFEKNHKKLLKEKKLLTDEIIKMEKFLSGQQ